jgi:hypothetical protein
MERPERPVILYVRKSLLCKDLHTSRLVTRSCSSSTLSPYPHYAVCRIA